MAQYPFDFRDETTGALPAGVTSWNDGDGTWDVATIDSENRLRFSGDSNNSNRGVGIDADDTDTNNSTEEVLSVVRASAKDASGTHIGVYARWNGSVSSPDQYTVWLRGEDELQLSRFSGGSFSPRVTVAFSWSVDTDYLIRFRITNVDSTTINFKARAWQRGASEPGTWDIDENESHSAGSNWFSDTGKGVICFRSSGSTRSYSWISIATEGETADSLDSSGTPVSVDISAGTLSLSSQSLQAQAGAQPGITAGPLSFTGQTQEVAAGASSDIQAGTLTLTPQTLAIQHGVSATIGAGSLSLTGQSLTVTTGPSELVRITIRGRRRDHDA